jgi:hypothetical protein
MARTHNKNIVAYKPVAGQRQPDKKIYVQQLLLSNGFAKKHVSITFELRGTVFSVRPVPGCYKQDT